MAELKDRNKSMKDELFRLSQRYSRRMSMVRAIKPFVDQKVNCSAELGGNQHRKYCCSVVAAVFFLGHATPTMGWLVVLKRVNSSGVR